jgi:hypothetical protein
MISDYNSLERNLRDLRSILACIAWQQEDKVLEISVEDLEAMPKDVILDISFNNIRGCYTFRTSRPASPIVGTNGRQIADESPI